MDRPAARTLPALLDELAARFPDRDAVIDGERRLGFAALRDRSLHLARGFAALGVGRGDKVAILMGNQLEWLLVEFAVAALGGALVALNTWWKAGEIGHALELSQARVLVTVDRYAGNDYDAELSRLDLAAVRVVRLGGGADGGATGGAMTFDELLALAGRSPAVRPAARPEDPACLLFTSGSTARSKAVPLLHRGLIENMHGIGERMHLGPDDRLLMTVSLFWSFGCANALFAAFTHGSAVVLQHRFEPGETLRLVEAERCTVLYTQPNIVLALFNHPDRARRDLRSWRTGICRPQMLDLLAEMGPQEMITSYGLTECYGNSCNSDAHWPVEVRRLGSGHPLPGNEIEVVDPATRAPVPAGGEGEIRIRGNVTPGYHRDPARTAEAIDADGWFYTGDLGRFEPTHGVLQFRSRLKELIRTGGINVTPADVEAVLEAHPAVRQACVVGVADPVREEAVAALVVLHPGGAATPAELIAHCRREVAAFKVPRHVELAGAEGMPLTDTGKVAKRLVQARLQGSYRG